MNNQLDFIPEPKILFGFDQELEDPRDGLSLFGPVDGFKPYGISSGVIGTKNGLQKFKKWLTSVQAPNFNSGSKIARPFFPGFEAVFKIPWGTKNIYEIEISEEELKKCVFHEDKHIRTFKTVELFSDKVIKVIQNNDSCPAVWFFIIPDYVYSLCRPQSTISKDLIIGTRSVPKKIATKFVKNVSLFDELNEAARPYMYEVNFHHQLKGRLLGKYVSSQIIRESTLAPEAHLNKLNQPIRDLAGLKGHIAWTVSTATYFKAGARPWKLSNIRDGVCYLGLAYKKTNKKGDEQNACCAAQMFLDSGNGMVFKGAVGPWYNPLKGEFHLNKEQAKEIIELAVNTYTQNNGYAPKELFIHAKTRFNDVEWEGFKEGIGKDTNLVGVTIKPTNALKLFKNSSDYPALRGLAFIRNDKSAFLWTKGFIPRLQTSSAMEVPNPLYIELSKGMADIRIVLSDILALTKLNYNSCIYGDGIPVTLRFANSVGEILTVGPYEETVPPLAFRFYI